MGLDILMVLAGLVALYLGAEGLVRGASSMALRLGITPLIVGLTVVSFGTSAPELLVSLLGSDDISIGNIIGSNIANIALILGAASLVRPIEVQAQAVRREMPIMLVATVLFMVLIANGTLSIFDGIILLAAMVAYLYYMYLQAKKDMAAYEAELLEELGDVDPTKSTSTKDILFVIGGILGLAGGAQLMVVGATNIALVFGISELVIAISIVAFGTSLPELATSLVASFRGESDISVGNVIGSNIFNLLFVMGVVAVALGGITVSSMALQIDMWVMLAISILIWPLLRTGHVLTRVEGCFLLLFYISYMVSLFLRTQPPA